MQLPRRFRPSPGQFIVVTALAAALAPAESRAQQTSSTQPPATCFGYSYVARPAALLAEGVRTVMEIVPGSPAEAGGLRPGDIIVSVAGYPTNRPTPAPVAPGDTIEFVVSREGRNVTLVMVVGQPEPGPAGDPVCRPAPRPESRR